MRSITINQRIINFFSESSNYTIASLDSLTKVQKQLINLSFIDEEEEVELLTSESAQIFK